MYLFIIHCLIPVNIPDFVERKGKPVIRETKSQAQFKNYLLPITINNATVSTSRSMPELGKQSNAPEPDI